tara:strand:- start:24 stop:737 length:714 start_codon:yes stop_codon:yes gene_type:complete
MSAIEEIEKLKKLLDEGTLSKEQYDLLLNDIIGKNKKPSKEEQLLADGAITKEQFNILTKQTNSSNPPAVLSTNTEKKEVEKLNNTSILKKFFNTEMPYEMKRMDLLKYASTERKHLILARHNVNEILPKNSSLKVNTLDEMLFFYDDSLWGNAKGGMLITDKAIFFREYDDGITYHLDWDEITGFDGVYFNSNKITIHFFDSSNNEIGAKLFGSVEQGVFISDLFERIFEFKKSQI